jgi:two-component system nitrate/nitrite response regulator NarL
MPERTATRPLVVIAIPDADINSKWTQAIPKKFAVHVAIDRGGLEWSMTHLKPAILILDLSFPKLGRGSAVSTIQQLSPTTKTIILSKAPDEKEGVFMLKAGAKGYCKNDMDPALIKKVVAMVPKGEIWVERKVIHHLIEEMASLTKRLPKEAPANANHLEHLTPREREIVHQVAGGASNKEIANRLNVTEATIKAHLTAVFRKLGLSDRLHLAIFVNNRL